MSDLMERPTHQAMVRGLVKSGRQILDEMSPSTAHLLHMAVGIAGEAGELLDTIKKVAIYGQIPDLPNIIEELGDLEFYLEGLRQQLEITRQTTLDRNIEKLGLRYDGWRYSNNQAIQRNDKNKHV